MGSNGGGDIKKEGDLPWSHEERKELRVWVSAVPSSSTRKHQHLSRDFADGVGVARLVQHYMPQLVGLQIHNYVPSLSTPQKRINWSILQKKVFTKLNLTFDQQLVEDVIEAKPCAVEQVLFDLRKKILSLSPVTKTQSASSLDVVKPQPPQSLIKIEDALPVRSRSYASVTAVVAPRLPSPSRPPSSKTKTWDSELLPPKSALRLPGSKSQNRKKVTFNLLPEYREIDGYYALFSRRNRLQQGRTSRRPGTPPPRKEYHPRRKGSKGTR